MIVQVKLIILYIFNIMLTQDSTQRLKVAGLFMLQFYKITTGTLLSLFVPQKCGEKVCTITENFNNKETYHEIVMYTNFISMFIFLTFYVIELCREEWCVRRLDVNNNFSDNHLKNIIEKIPKLNNRMDKINKVYYYLFLINFSTYMINLSLSVKLLKDNYHSSATISSFCSFVLLVLMKMFNSFTVSRESLKNDKMMSAFMMEFISFNIFDKDYLIKNNYPEEINYNEKNKIIELNKNTNEIEKKENTIDVSEIEIIPKP